MYEVELKVEAEHDAVRDRLEALDAEYLGVAIQADTYYDAPHRNFEESDEALRIRRESRVKEREKEGRREQEKGRGKQEEGRGKEKREREDGERKLEGGEKQDTRSELTYKGPKIDRSSKSREEIETTIGSDEASDAILQSLGFEPVADVRKRRERYRLGGYTVALDEVDDAGTFVEVETEVEARVGPPFSPDEDAPIGAAADAADVVNAREKARDILSDLGLDPDAQIRTSYLGLLASDAGE